MTGRRWPRRKWSTRTTRVLRVRFRMTSDPAAVDEKLAGREVYGLIWTTTPWTLPANLAISFHPKFEYTAVEVGGAVYIVATDLLPITAKKCGWETERLVTRF